MYFSRIRIRPEIFKGTQLSKVLTDNSYNIHRLLWDLFSRPEATMFFIQGRERSGTVRNFNRSLGRTCLLSCIICQAIFRKQSIHDRSKKLSAKVSSRRQITV